MAATMRLPPDLEAAATAYAAQLGISRNALVAVALRDYLDRRVTPPSGGPSAARPAPATPALLPQPLAPLIEAQTFSPPKSRSDPCPCGAKSPEGHRLKWKHCHGRPA